jgi:hypothetical protein
MATEGMTTLTLSDSKGRSVHLVHSPDDEGWYLERYSPEHDIEEYSPVYATREEAITSLKRKNVRWE